MSAAERVLQESIRAIGALRACGLADWAPEEDFERALHESSAELKQREADAAVAVQKANDAHVGLLSGLRITSYGVGRWYGWVS